MEPEKDLDSEASELDAKNRDLTRRDLLIKAGFAGAGIALGGALAAPVRAASGLKLTSSDVTFRVADAVNKSLVNEPLLGINQSSEPFPLLAESWSQTSSTHYVVHLRHGVRFSDGSLVTPADVSYSFLRYNDPSLAGQNPGNAAFTSEIKSIRPQGARELVFELKNPDALFPWAFTEFPIYKESFTKPLGTSYGLSPDKWLGTGPFIMTKSDASGKTVTRNPHYWGKAGPLSRVEFVQISDPDAQFLAMQSGSVDAVFNLSGLDAVRYASLPGVKVTGALALESFLSFNLNETPFNDIHVRRAIAHCWDARGFISGPMRGLGLASNGLVMPWQWNSVLTPAQRRAYYKTLPSYPFSIAQAKAELSKSSVPNGFTIETVTTNYWSTMPLALQTLEANLAKIGITLNFSIVDVNSWANAVFTGKYPMLHLMYTPYYADPSDILGITVGKGAYNFANYNSPSVLKWVAKEEASINRKTRANTLRQIYTQFAHDLPYLGLWYEDQAAAIRKPFEYTWANFSQFATPWWRYIKV
jgi:peptide/nickel transport system substrate-binding protein